MAATQIARRQIKDLTAKPNAFCASTANLSLAAPGATIDGVSPSSGDYVLLKNQTATAENGLYRFNGAASALTRALEMDAWTEVPGAIVTVEQGTTQADSMWLCTSNTGGTIDVTSITWKQIDGLSSSSFVSNETPTGAINSANTTFTLANIPNPAASLDVFLNGLKLASGAGNDYTLAGSTLTMLTAPLTGDGLVVSYRK